MFLGFFLFCFEDLTAWSNGSASIQGCLVLLQNRDEKMSVLKKDAKLNVTCETGFSKHFTDC